MKISPGDSIPRNSINTEQVEKPEEKQPTQQNSLPTEDVRAHQRAGDRNMQNLLFSQAVKVDSLKTPPKSSTSGSQAISNQHYVTAPIKELTQEEADSALEIFKQNLISWEPDSDLKKEEVGHGHQAQETSTTTPEKDRWIERLRQTHHLIDHMRDTDYPDSTFLAYYVKNQPVGMLIMEEQPQNLFITAIVTHPGSEGAGGALIEAAVNTSVKRGKDGKLELYPENENARKAYEALGFCKLRSNMTLDPDKSDKWCRQDDGQWRIQKHQDMKYLVDFGGGDS